jgi:hypothetical protein
MVILRVISNEDGYSLLDTITAIALIGIVLVFVNMFVAGLFGSADIMHKREVAFIARQEVYKALSVDFPADTIIHYRDGFRLVRKIEYQPGERYISIDVYDQNNRVIVSYTALLAQDTE